LNYTNTPVGKDRSLVGTVKNIGPVDVHGSMYVKKIYCGNVR